MPTSVEAGTGEWFAQSEIRPMLTVFTSPKPFRGSIDVLQRNAIGSWRRLDPTIEVLLIGDEEGMSEAAAAEGVRHVRGVDRNPLGTPRLDSIFRLATQEAHHSVLCYVNADILLLDDFLPAVRQVAEHFDRYLIVGQRWDLDVPDSLRFDGDWRRDLRHRARSRGRLHPPAGSDHFVFPKGLFANMPAFALGRAGWDNWMIYAGRAEEIAVVDVTEVVTVVHQTHDYSHLPGGRPHYRLPESRENVVLAGGREVIFGLRDADWRLDSAGISRKGWRDVGLRRWLEAGWIVRVGPGRTAQTVRMLFHPIDTLGYFAKRILGRVPASHGTDVETRMGLGGTDRIGDRKP